MLSNLSACAVIPQRTADPETARAALWRDGAVILTGLPTDAEAATGLARRMLSSDLALAATPIAVRERGGVDQSNIAAITMSHLHTDGFAYGAKAPDVFFLLCAAAGDTGGGSFLVDEVALLDQLAAAGGESAELATFALTCEVDQTEPGSPTVIGTLAHRTDSGRLMVRCPLYVRPLPTDPDPIRTSRLISQWQALHNLLSTTIERFLLQPGDGIAIDNYRLTHGRDGYIGEDRMMWRCWAWTTRAQEVPEGPVSSDTREIVEGARLEAAAG